MAKQLNNVLIIAATSDMARDLIRKLSNDEVNIYATYRNKLDVEMPYLNKFYLDVSNKNEIDGFLASLSDIQFDAVVCFQGVAIVSPVEYLSDDELLRQFKISVFSLLDILKGLKNKIKKDGIVINLSSMSSFGIYPFLAPYSMAKACCDILLNCYEIETGIKTVSLKPGVVSTKFWKYCVNENKANFSAFKDDYKQIGEFLKNNALKNSSKGISAEKVSNLIYKILYSKNPKSSYTIGQDSKFANIASFFKGRLLFGIIRKILDKRVKGYINGK